jgi:hypothetical protein
LRLIAVVLLGGLTVLYLVFAIRLSFLPAVDAAVTGILGIAFAVAALGYGLLARVVAKRSRGGHITAVVVTVLGAILAVSAGMEWLDWLVLAANLAAFGVLLGCVPRRAASAAPHSRARRSSPSRSGPFVPVTTKLSPRSALAKPARRSSFTAALAAEPLNAPAMTVSKVTTSTSGRGASAAIHSARPTDPCSPPSPAAFCLVVELGRCRLCVGEPTSSSRTSGGIVAGASSGRSTVTSTPCAESPDAISLPTVVVFPKCDSTTIRTDMATPR